MDVRVKCLQDLLESCILCPRRCRVNRRRGEKGFCGLTRQTIIKCALPHHGEEPPISGRYGAGTIFFSSCNLKCSFCQNYQISLQGSGRPIDTGELAAIMLDLQEKRCHNIEAVTPTPQVPGFAEALSMARRGGLRIPIVYNCGGYEEPSVLRLLDGLVDIYLPDFKYGIGEEGLFFSGVRDYPQCAIDAISEMVRQVGDCLDTEGGIAKKGIIVRHLVLPGRRENSFRVLALMREHVSPSVPISIMSQYTPPPAWADHPVLGRRVTAEEYDCVVNRALDLGFEEIFVQDVDERTLCPDFDRKDPFIGGSHCVEECGRSPDSQGNCG